MSTSFRIFLLMLLGFGAVWAYRFRSEELSQWLWPRPSTMAASPEDSLVSPVDSVLPSELNLAVLRLEGPALRVPRSSFQAWDEDGYEFPEEEAREAADLPLLDEDPSGDTAPVTQLGTEDEGVEAEPVLVPERGDVGEDRPEPPRDAGGADVLAYEEFSYKVQKGDSLWKIAEKFLGSGHRYREIVELNREILVGEKVDRVPEGTDLRIRRPVQKEALKMPPGQTDTSVEGNSARRAPAPERKLSLHRTSGTRTTRR